METMFSKTTLRDIEYKEVFDKLKEKFTIHELEQLAATGKLPDKHIGPERMPVDRSFKIYF